MPRPPHIPQSVTITCVTEHKTRFLSLLLLADEQESMINRYLSRGRLYVMTRPAQSDAVIAVAVVTDEGQGTLELKNLAVAPAFQRQGYGKMMIEYLASLYRTTHRILLVGTGDSPLTLPFYHRCGFTYSHTLPDFFTLHYDHPIIEGGRRLRHMICLKRPLR